MIALALRRSTEIACYDLLDHCRSLPCAQPNSRDTGHLDGPKSHSVLYCPDLAPAALIQWICTRIAILPKTAHFIVISTREWGTRCSGGLAPNAMRAIAAIAAGTSAVLHSSKPSFYSEKETYTIARRWPSTCQKGCNDRRLPAYERSNAQS